MSTNQPLTAAMLFAKSQGSECIGDGRWRCHWCGSPTLNEFIHDDPPPVPFVRSYSTAKCPAESYICYGCWLWRRGKTTINFLGGDFQDGQYVKNHSWWITEEGAWALRGQRDFDEAYRFLIKPPKRFVLALRQPGEGIDTLIQLAIANDPGGIIAKTPLHFTINNIPHEFTIYDLTESFKNGKDVYGPGVRALWDFLGEPPDDIKKKYPTPKEDVRKQGERQKRDNPLKTIEKVVVASGEGKKAA